MKQKKSNTFGSLCYMGLAIIGMPVVFMFIIIIMVLANKNTEDLADKVNSESIKKEKIIKIIEKVYIYDTIEIPCRRKHCDEHTQKKVESKQTVTIPISKPDTLK